MPARCGSARIAPAARWSPAWRSRRPTSTTLGLASSRANSYSKGNPQQDTTLTQRTATSHASAALPHFNLNSNNLLLSRGPQNDDHFSALFSNPKLGRMYTDSCNPRSKNPIPAYKEFHTIGYKSMASSRAPPEGVVGIALEGCLRRLVDPVGIHMAFH